MVKGDAPCEGIENETYIRLKEGTTELSKALHPCTGPAAKRDCPHGKNYRCRLSTDKENLAYSSFFIPSPSPPLLPPLPPLYLTLLPLLFFSILNIANAIKYQNRLPSKIKVRIRSYMCLALNESTIHQSFCRAAGKFRLKRLTHKSSPILSTACQCKRRIFARA